MWDDYLILRWQGHPEWVWAFYTNYGLAPLSILMLPFAYGAGVNFARVVCFLGAVAIGLLTQALTAQIANRRLALAAGCLAATFPALSGPGFNPTSLIYFVCLPAFLAAFVVRSRLLATGLLLASFSLNSLLVLFYGLLPAARRLWPLAALPLVYWLAKESLWPRVGVYALYNPIQPAWAIAAVVEGCIIIGLLARERLLALGAFATAGAILPYLLVGRREFPLSGIMARDSVLLAIPAAWTLCAVRLHWLALPFFIVANWLNHISWQDHYRLYQAAIAQVPREGILWIDDQLPLGPLNARYPTSIWTAAIGTFATPHPPADGRRYSTAELSQRLAETQVAFMLPAPSGPQYKVTLSPLGTTVLLLPDF